MLDVDDIQHFLLTRPRAMAARYGFLCFRRPEHGRAWLAGPIRKRITALPAFTTVRGGAYFFLPGVRALRFLAEGARASDVVSSSVEVGFSDA